MAKHPVGDGMDFWVLWRALGWYVDPAPQHSHIKKVVSWLREEDALLLHTDDGETLRVSILYFSDDCRAWEEAQRERKSDPAPWAQADRAQVEYFRQLAEGWGKPQ